MKKLYLITGPSGVGKSATSKELAFRLEKSALIEGDDIYHQVIGSYHSPWDKLNHLDIFWKVSINIIKTYLENGYDVVFNYIIDNDDYINLKKEFKNIDIKFTVLMVQEETIIKRDLSRPSDCRMHNRCIELLKEFNKHSFDKSHIIYTDNLTIKETVEIILKGANHE